MSANDPRRTFKVTPFARIAEVSGLVRYTVSDILKLARKFKNIDAELYKVRRSLEPKISETEMRAASSFLRAS